MDIESTTAVLLWKSVPSHSNPATGHSIPAVLPQVSPAKPWDSRGYRGTTAIPITMHGSNCRTSPVQCRRGPGTDVWWHSGFNSAMFHAEIDSRQIQRHRCHIPRHPPDCCLTMKHLQWSDDDCTQYRTQHHRYLCWQRRHQLEILCRLSVSRDIDN